MAVRTSDSGNTALKETLQRHRYRLDDHKHPVNVIHHEHATFGEQLADGIASFIGSWRFLIIQTALVITWVTINSLQATGKSTSTRTPTSSSTSLSRPRPPPPA